jgi:hypothetical protein
MLESGEGLALGMHTLEGIVEEWVVAALSAWLTKQQEVAIPKRTVELYF